MVKDCNCSILACSVFGLLVFNPLVFIFVSSKTDSNDVSALNIMYTGMNSPSQLDGWKASGGDPCDDAWKGITCTGSKVAEIDLSNSRLSGSLGYKLADMASVTYLDLSKNNFKGSIPYQLPPNLQHIDLSGNEFDGTVPYSVSQMSKLKEIDLSNNKLNGQLSDMFGQLSKLTRMDLSSNSLSGELPLSFKNLSSLNTLHLQKNQLTGSINVLASLPLDDLNIKSNKFTGWIPDELKGIKKLDTGGNSWSSSPAPPPPPGAKSQRAPPSISQSSEGSTRNAAVIAGSTIGVLVVIGIIIAIFSKRRTPPPSYYFDEHRRSGRMPFSPVSPRELPNDFGPESRLDFQEINPPKLSSSIKARSLRSTSISLRHMHTDCVISINDNDKKTSTGAEKKTVVNVFPHSLADLQTATSNFATTRLLGEGSIGRVYRAKYGDGKVLAVKKIDSSLFQGHQDIQFLELISNISKLHHPNISEIVGHCSEQGQNMLIYEYFRNGSLHEFLHMSDDFSRPLTWNTRVKIALGAARAIEYLHEGCTPSIIHKNIKSSNILLDIEFNPRLSECGLAIFYEQKNQNLVAGYNPPECTKPSAFTMKSDVYCFGVVMLELMTGRTPFDSQKPKFEQSLVRWATPQLHDIDSLATMVDPALRGLYSPKSLSRYADVIALCVQSEPEFRPMMSEVVESLVRLVQRSSMNQRGNDLNASCRTDDSDY